MPLITTSQLETLLLGVKSSTFVTITTYTLEDKMNKNVEGTPNPFYKQLYKRSKVNGTIRFYYDRAVNKKRDKEDKDPDFVALPRSWGEWIDGSPLVISDKGNVSLVIMIKSREHQYEQNGEIIPTEIVDPWLRETQEGTRQGLDNPVVYRNFRLDNITNINMNGEWFDIDHPQRVTA